MIKKQDIAAPRTVQDMERRYKFGKTFAETMGLAKEASKAAEKAEETVESLDSESVFNLLTENGTKGGFFIGNGENGTTEGDIYINAAYIKAGILSGDLIKAGVIQSADGGVKIDLNNGYGNLARSQTIWLDGYDADAMPIGITEQLKGFLTEKARKLREAVDDQNGRAQDYTIRVGTLTDEEGYPNFGEVTLQVFRSPAGPIRAGVSFEWWNGNISHMTGEAEDEAEDSNWSWSDMKWITGDYIVEQGTSGIWTYRKWNSGKIELWTNSYQFTVTFTKSSIGIYYATQNNIPVPLVKNIEFASGDCTKWHYVNWASVTCNDGKNLGIRYYGLNANGGGNTIPFSFYVIGTWK